MYSIFIKIEAVEKRKRSATVLHIVIGFFLLLKGADYYRLSGFKGWLFSFLVFLVALTSLGYGFLKNRFDKEGRYNQPVRIAQALVFAILGIMIIGYAGPADYIGSFIWSALCLILLATERNVFSDTNLLIEKKGITVPGYYTNHLITWSELSDIVVRQDYVTLFHKKNKYLQYQVLQSLSDVEIVQVNGFCKERLSLSNAAAINN